MGEEALLLVEDEGEVAADGRSDEAFDALRVVLWVLLNGSEIKNTDQKQRRSDKERKEDIK